MLQSAGLMMKEALQIPGELWNRRSAVQTPMYVVGLTVILSGLFHIFVWLFSGGSLEGPVSWRKPIVFGLSGGIATISVAWVMGLLRQRKVLLTMSWIFSIFMFFEIALITMQQWRGTASHFNRATPLDALIFNVMGFLITVIAVLIFVVTLYSFRDLNAEPEMKSAIRAGLILLNIGNLLGILLVIYGNFILQTNPGHAPNIYGGSGMMKVPHAIALHGIQILPFFAWLLKFTKRESAFRLRIVRAALTGYFGLQMFALAQTFTGRAPLDVTPVSSAILIVSIGLLAFAFLWAVLEIKNNSTKVQPMEVSQ